MPAVTEKQVRELFGKIEDGDWPGFFENVADDVNWTVTNPRLKTQPLSGVYTSKQAFQQALKPLNECFASPLALKVEHVIVAAPSGDMQNAVVELRAQSKGKSTGMEFDNYYCWVLEIDTSKEKPVIARVRAYLDSALVKDLMAKEA